MDNYNIFWIELYVTIKLINFNKLIYILPGLMTSIYIILYFFF